MNKINSYYPYQEDDHGSPYFPFQSFSQIDTTGQYFAPYHWHQDIEFLYVTQGRIILHTEKEKILLKQGQIYFINPGTLHGIFGNSLHSHHYALLFHPEFLSFSRYDICQNQFLEPIISGNLLFPDGRSLSPEINASIQSLIEKAALSYDQKLAVNTLTIKICLFQILELLFQNNLMQPNLQKKSSSSEDHHTSIRNVFLYIEKNFSSKITLEEMADCLHMNKNYFCRYFKEKTGKTPFSYLNEYRINQAAALLLRSSLSITDIALSCGFDNISYFIRQFKHYHCCTPSQFRDMASSEK